MTDMFVGMFALAFVEHNKAFINQARDNAKNGYVWEYDPGFINKDALSVAFEGNGKKQVIWRQKKVVRIPLPKPEGMK